MPTLKLPNGKDISFSNLDEVNKDFLPIYSDKE